MSEDLIGRVAAAQATLDQFRDKPFRFGHRDCVRLAAAHLRRMGHKVKLPPAGSYASERSARKALRERGFSDLAAAVDALGFKRIAPAAAIAGDLLLVPAEGSLGGALHVVLTNGRSVGYHQDAIGAVVLQAREWVTAWRVDGCHRHTPSSDQPL